MVVLPEPLGPEQAEDFALLDFQVERLEGPDLLAGPRSRDRPSRGPAFR